MPGQHESGAQKRKERRKVESWEIVWRNIKKKNKKQKQNKDDGEALSSAVEEMPASNMKRKVRNKAVADISQPCSAD